MIAEVSVALKLKHLRRVFKIKGAVYTPVSSLKGEVVVTAEPVPFSERENHKAVPVKKGQKFGVDKRGFLDCAWLHVTGLVPEKLDKANTIIWLNTWSEGALFDDNGTPLQSTTIIMGFSDAFNIKFGKQALDIPDNAIKNGQLDFWVELGNNGFMGKPYGQSRIKTCCLATVDREKEAFYYDYLTLYLSLVGCSEEREKAIDKALDKSFALFRKDVNKARALLLPLLTATDDNKGEVIAVGHSHIDTAWLWPLRETRRKIGRTFSTAVRNMDKYPYYVFGASSPLQYQWVKEDYPALYEKIKQKVKEGRFEPLGSMWIEPDINLSGGESIIRQTYYGKKFFQDEFGYVADTCWLPDVFGFSGALPQLLRGCGVDKFVTIKLSWNKFNKFPLTTFVWEGIDGSEVLVHMPPEGTYASDMAPFSIYRAEAGNKDDKEVNDVFLMPFGPGDGGGGAGEVHLELLKREQNLAELPKVKCATVREFFERISTVQDKLPRYRGELYLEAHQGTYTSFVEQKYHNRLCERLLHNMEFFETLGTYDKALHEELWKEVLLQQFHDILPGTSIDRVQKESIESYFKTENKIEKYIAKMQSALTSEGGITAVNSSAVSQRVWREKEGLWYYCDIPAYSLKTVTPSLPDSSKLIAKDNTLSNGILTIEFAKDGSIKSLKTADGREYASPHGLNRLQVYKDEYMFWNASDMDSEYYEKPKGKPRLKGQRFITESGRVICRQEYAYGKTLIVQNVVLSADCDYVKFDLDIDFHEKLKMLRADFYPADWGKNAVCDIQMGNISRSTETVDSIDKAKFEVSAHKYVDVSGKGFGAAILSRDRYSFRAKDGYLSLNLVRGTVFPGKSGGQGKHSVSYAYYPHKNGFAESGVTERAYAFNYPVQLVSGKCDYSLPLTTDKQNIKIETVKPAEDGNGVVYRLYEDTGVATTAHISIEGSCSAQLCDLLENGEDIMKDLKLNFKPYEIKTLKVFKN